MYYLCNASATAIYPGLKINIPLKNQLAHLFAAPPKYRIHSYSTCLSQRVSTLLSKRGEASYLFQNPMLVYTPLYSASLEDSPRSLKISSPRGRRHGRHGTIDGRIAEKACIVDALTGPWTLSAITNCDSGSRTRCCCLATAM